MIGAVAPFHVRLVVCWRARRLALFDHQVGPLLGGMLLLEHVAAGLHA